MSSSILQSFILAAVVYATMFRRADPPRLVGTMSGDEPVSLRDGSGASSTSATPLEQSPRRRRRRRHILSVDPEVDTSVTPPHARPPPVVEPEVDTSTSLRRAQLPLPVGPEIETTSGHGRPQTRASSKVDGVFEADQTVAPTVVGPAKHSGLDAQFRPPVPVFSSPNDRSMSQSTASQPSPSIYPVRPVRGRPVPSENLYRQSIPQAPPTPSPTPALVHTGRELPQVTVFDPASWTPDSTSRPLLVAPAAGTPVLVGVQHPDASTESINLAPPVPTESISLAATAPASQSVSSHGSVREQILPRIQIRAAAKNRKAAPRSISAPITRSVTGVPAVPSSASHFGGTPHFASTSHTAPTLTAASASASHEPIPADVSEPEVVFERHFRAFKGMAGVVNEIGDPVGTHWFASESRFPIILPPQFLATPGVQLGDVYQHHTPFGDQLWVCGTAASGLWYWKPIQEGTRRADGRKLTITKTCKEPSWVL